ncbi:hypothetical protein [Bosea rubneri]|uniref:Uncharacterized protein n=1 Tax=Bosea rubneri TaxID=3075434 RepID=A0ABU3SHN0_9HYPH|nr:hypothetical protein [Bosea sp. ZW T0_25]MDU0343902.1 hypothetical protein [Bosea sp. ZW T0_25]
MSNLINNESAKLAAQMWGNAAVGSFLTGIIVPLVSFVGSDRDWPARNELLVGGFGMMLAVVFWTSAFWSLKSLRDQ